MIGEVKGLATVRGYRGLPRAMCARWRSRRRALAPCAHRRPAGRGRRDQSVIVKREASLQSTASRAEGNKTFPLLIEEGAAEGAGCTVAEIETTPACCARRPSLSKRGNARGITSARRDKEQGLSPPR